MGLIVTRRVGESVVIGTAIVTCRRIEGGQVRIEIDAPRDVTIMRLELLERDRAREIHQPRTR